MKILGIIEIFDIFNDNLERLYIHVWYFFLYQSMQKSIKFDISQNNTANVLKSCVLEYIFYTETAFQWRYKKKSYVLQYLSSMKPTKIFEISWQTVSEKTRIYISRIYEHFLRYPLVFRQKMNTLAYLHILLLIMAAVEPNQSFNYS